MRPEARRRFGPVMYYVAPTRRLLAWLSPSPSRASPRLSRAGHQVLPYAWEFKESPPVY